MTTPASLQYVYRWRIGQWSTLPPCVEHNSPPFDADGLCWVFKLFKGRTRNPKELALYLAVHDSTTDRLCHQRKKVDISFTLENMRTRGLDYSKYTTPITVWVDAAYSTWGDDRFIDLADMDTFSMDDTVSLVVRFHVRETLSEGITTAVPSPAIAVYVPEKISAPFNQLLKSARFSDIQFELCDSSALLLSPGYSDNKGLLSPRNSGDFVCHDALRITCPDLPFAGPTPPQCVTPMPGNCCPLPLPYAQRPRIGSNHQSALSAGPRYHAHKAILIAVSPVFEAMFSNGMRETFEKVVEVWDVTPRAFERLLEFAYTRLCDINSGISADEIVETLLCADQFEVAELRDICWRNLVKRISPETVWEIWSLALDLEAVDQQRACRLFCSRNFTTLCQTSSTMWAPAHLLREVLASDTLNVLSEELLFETVVKWSNFREDQECSPADSASVLSAEKHISRPASTAGISDNAVLKCYRSPSNLSLLPPSSPYANNRRRSSAHPRRKPELTREAYTDALQLSSASSIPSPVTNSPRFLISATKLQSSRESPDTPSTNAWSRLFDRKQFLATLLPCIRFPMMDKNFLLRVVERNTDLMALPIMKDLLIEAYRFHAFNPPPPPPAPLLRECNRRSSECYAKREYASTPSSAPVYAKIILPLNATDDLTLSRSQRRKLHKTPKIEVQAINF